MIDYLGESIIIFSGFFIENNEFYYRELDDKKYTLKNVPYSLIIYNAIKHEWSPSSETSKSFPSSKWHTIFNYLMFTTFPIGQIFEEGEFMTREKKNFYRFFSGFCWTSRKL